MYTKPMRLSTLRFAAGFQTTTPCGLLHSHTDALPQQHSEGVFKYQDSPFFFVPPKFISKYQESSLDIQKKDES